MRSDVFLDELAGGWEPSFSELSILAASTLIDFDERVTCPNLGDCLGRPSNLRDLSWCSALRFGLGGQRQLHVKLLCDSYLADWLDLRFPSVCPVILLSLLQASVVLASLESLSLVSPIWPWLAWMIFCLASVTPPPPPLTLLALGVKLMSVISSEVWNVLVDKRERLKSQKNSKRQTIAKNSQLSTLFVNDFVIMPIFPFEQFTADSSHVISFNLIQL